MQKKNMHEPQDKTTKIIRNIAMQTTEWQIQEMAKALCDCLERIERLEKNVK